MYMVIALVMHVHKKEWVNAKDSIDGVLKAWHVGLVQAMGPLPVWDKVRTHEGSVPDQNITADVLDHKIKEDTLTARGFVKGAFVRRSESDGTVVFLISHIDSSEEICSIQKPEPNARPIDVAFAALVLEWVVTEAPKDEVCSVTLVLKIRWCVGARTRSTSTHT